MDIIKTLFSNPGSAAEWGAVLVAIGAAAWSYLSARRAATQQRQFEKAERQSREQFEAKQLERQAELHRSQQSEIESTRKRLLAFESALHRENASRQRLIQDVKHLEEIFGEIFKTFRKLLKEGSRNAEDDDLIDACKGSIKPLSDLQAQLMRMDVSFLPRHKKALLIFEDALVQIFLDVRRRSDERDAQYVGRVRIYERWLSRYETWAKKLIDQYHGGVPEPD